MVNKFLLDRTTYKKIKSFDRKQMEQFIKDIIDNAADNIDTVQLDTTSSAVKSVQLKVSEKAD